MSKELAVLVTTEHRGVFFGYTDPEPKVENGELTIRRARCCVYWTAVTHGFLGLASDGPSSDCRIGPAVPELTLRGITSVAKCTDAAVKRWEAGPWK